MKTSIASLLMIALLSAGTVSARTWTSVSGAKLEAEYAGRDGSAVMLKKADGKQLSIQINKLSAEDQAFLQTLEKPAGEAKAKPAANAKPAPAKNEPLFGSITYAPATPLTVENFPTIPLKQPDTATYWGFQYGPSADEVLYIAFDQPTMTDIHDTAYLYCPAHPKYRKPLPLPGKKGKFEEDRVFRFSGIELPAKHGDLNVSYSLEFVYGIERDDILTVFVTSQLLQRGATTRFLTGNFINEQVALEGAIPVVQALRPVKFSVSSKNKFGDVDVSASLRMGGWHLIPKSGMGKSVLIEVVDAESGRTVEKHKIELSEDAITSTRHGGPLVRLEKVKRGKTYSVDGSIDLGSLLGVATHSRPLKMPEEKDDEE